MSRIAADELKPRLTAGPEIALIDVRERGQYGEGHPFFAVNIPYSRLEIEVEALVPRKDAPVVLMDHGDGIAERAQRRLAALGYRSVDILDGGAAGWAQAGFTLYKGENVPSKAFGELVEHAARTPRLDAAELRRWQGEGAAMLIVDGRTPGEFARMSIPGAVNCPNAELGHRLPQMLADPTTPVVVNCAGRTRSIIGAQSLIDMGFPNPVFALENGTQGWALAGLDLEHGSPAGYPRELSPAVVAASRARAEAMIRRRGIKTVDLPTLAHWQEDEARTLYVLDVRTGEEFAAGHLEGSRHAPGGQLVQATDRWIAVRGARIALVDDTGLRAAVTAYWLAGMGHDAAVLRDDVSALEDLVTGEEPAVEVATGLGPCQPSALTRRLASGAHLLDLNASMAFRRSHINGARWAIRPRLDRLGLVPGGEVVLTAGDRRLAELAAEDLRELGVTRLAWLAGGAAAWQAAGLRAVDSPDVPEDRDCIDYLFFVHDRHDGNLDAARAYLAWETALPGQLDAQEKAVFRPLG